MITFHVTCNMSFQFLILYVSGGMYMHIEASNAARNAKAQLVSPDVTVPGELCLQFYYHMYGSHIGTLNVNITTKYQSKYNVWSLSGNQGNMWKKGIVGINETPPYKVRPNSSFSWPTAILVSKGCTFAFSCCLVCKMHF
jgi:hypothetical protein